jgi:Transposase and inactivated derivatives
MCSLVCAGIVGTTGEKRRVCPTYPKRLGLGTKTELYWGKEQSYEAQELSALAWPIRYRVLTREGYYLDEAGGRVHFTTQARGIDSRRQVSEVLMRAAMLLIVIAGVGYRRAAWLLKQLFHVEASKSAVRRSRQGECRACLADEIIRLLNQQQPITEAHFDEIFPRGMDECVLVLKDEHGRIVATQAVDQRDEESVKPFLQRMKDIGLQLQSFYIDGCQAYYNAIRAVFGQAVKIQYDYFHILQNAWRHLWRWAVEHRRQIKANSEQVSTLWYKKKLKALAKSLWENRYLLFKAEERLREEEKERLFEILQADQKVGHLRAFLGGIWRIFEDSQDEQQAQEALAQLKQMPIDGQNPQPFEKVIRFLEQHFNWMTTFLRHEGVRRNSLAETGMRVLRRLKVEHDGFRSDQGRDNFLRIYQAIKYLGWTVYHPLPEIVKNT